VVPGDAAATEMGGEDIEGKVAWNIEGALVRQFDGEQEHSFEFTLYSPCHVGLTNKDAGETSIATFVFVGDELHVGLGAVGLVVGDTTIVCSGIDVYTLRGGECMKWSEMFDDWKGEKAECELSGEGEARRFVVGATSLQLFGDALLEQRGELASSHADFEAAKQAAKAGG
jgi:hypothetical protein